MPKSHSSKFTRRVKADEQRCKKRPHAGGRVSNPASSVFCVHKNPKYTACQRDTPKTPTMQKGDEENETKRGIRYPRYYREISGEQRRSETYRKQVQKQRLQVQKRLLPHYDISRANNQGKR